MVDSNVCQSTKISIHLKTQAGSLQDRTAEIIEDIN